VSTTAPPDATIGFGTPEYVDLAVQGKLLPWLDGKRVLVKPPA
jgi:hypothetical protein